MEADLLSDLLPFILAAVTIYWLHRRHEKKSIEKQKRAQARDTPPIPPDEPENDEDSGQDAS